MIILGVILLLISWLAALPPVLDQLLWVIGWILLVVGLILLALSLIGKREVGGRKYWY